MKYKSISLVVLVSAFVLTANSFPVASNALENDHDSDNLGLTSPKLNIDLPQMKPEEILEDNIPLEKRERVITGHVKVTHLGNNKVMKNTEDMDSLIGKSATTPDKVVHDEKGKKKEEEGEENLLEKRGKKSAADVRVRNVKYNKKNEKRTMEDNKIWNPQSPSFEKRGKKSMVDFRVRNVKYNKKNEKRLVYETPFVKRGKKSAINVRVKNLTNNNKHEKRIMDDNRIWHPQSPSFEKRGKKSMVDFRVRNVKYNKKNEKRLMNDNGIWHPQSPSFEKRGKKNLQLMLEFVM